MQNKLWIWNKDRNAMFCNNLMRPDTLYKNTKFCTEVQKNIQVLNSSMNVPEVWSPLADPHSRPLTTGIDLLIKGMGKQRFSSAKKRIIEQNLCSLIHLQSWSNSSQLHWVILHLSFSNNTQFSSMRRTYHTVLYQHTHNPSQGTPSTLFFFL